MLESRRLFMEPCYSSCLTISISPQLTHDFSASWRVQATAVSGAGRRQDRAAPLPGICICLIPSSPWMPTQGLWQFCCPTFEHGAKGLELEAGTLFLLKGNLLGHMKSLCQLLSHQCSQC